VTPDNLPLWGIKKGEKEMELPSYHSLLRSGPRLFPPSRLQDQLDWVWRGVPRNRMLEALLNIGLVEAWIGSHAAIQDTDFYQEVAELVELIGNKEHKKALEIIVILGKVARRHEIHLRGGKRRLLKRTRGRRI